ncbi:MAG: hypothetical protein U0Z53_26505 [Blastocatellia bacterium]
MMKATVRILSAALLMVVMTGMAVYAQGPLHKRVNYSINVPYALRMGDYMLPAGHYVLYQIDQNNPNLFGLYQGDLTHPPVAILHTVRIDFASRGWPEKTKLLIRHEEEGYGQDTVPVLRGWTIPGMDGWEIIGVVQARRGVLARVE